VLSPAFSTNQLTYSLIVPVTSTTTGITAVPTDPTATIYVQNKVTDIASFIQNFVAASGVPTVVASNSTTAFTSTVNVTVVAQDGITSTTYTLALTRANTSGKSYSHFI